MESHRVLRGVQAMNSRFRGKLTAAERELVATLHTDLVQLSDDPTPTVERILPKLHELLHADQSVAYRAVPDDRSFALDSYAGVGLPAPFQHELAGLLKRSTREWGVYNPARPQAAQRNIVLRPESLVDSRDTFLRTPVAQQLFVPFELHRQDQIRVLICDGPVLLTWIGGFRAQAFTNLEVELLGTLVTPLLRRLKLERQLSQSEVLQHGLTAALEALPSAAFLTRADGRIEFANALGREQMAVRGKSLTAELRAALANPSASVASSILRVMPLNTRGLCKYALVILESQRASNKDRLAAASRGWCLTARQAEVLACVASGDTNKEICAKLELAEITVEKHMSALLQKAKVENRAALVAKFWTSLPH